MNYYSHCKKLSETNPFNPGGFFGGKPPRSLVDSIIQQNPNIIVDVDLSVLYDDRSQCQVESSIDTSSKLDASSFESLLESNDDDFDPTNFMFDDLDFEVLSPLQNQSNMTRKEKFLFIEKALEQQYQDEAIDDFEAELYAQDEEDMQFLALALMNGEAIVESYNNPQNLEKAIDFLSPADNNEFFNNLNSLALSKLTPSEPDEIQEILELKNFNEEALTISDGKENLIREFFEPVLKVNENDLLYLISKLNDYDKPFFIKEPSYVPRSPGHVPDSSETEKYVLNPYYNELMSQEKLQLILKFLTIQLKPSWILEEKQAAQLNFQLPKKFEKAILFVIHALINDKSFKTISKYKIPIMNKILKTLESTLDRLFFRFSLGSINVDYSWARYFQKYMFNPHRKNFKYREFELNSLDSNFFIKFKMLISFYLVTMYTLKGKRLVISDGPSVFEKFKLLALDGYLLKKKLVTVSLVS